MKKTVKNLCVAGLMMLLPGLTQAELTPRQTTLMMNNCIQCHTKPILGAPLIGDQKAWQKVLAKGEDEVLKNVVQGYFSMPPLGYCSSCDEADFRALIKAMSGLPAQQ